MIKLTTKEQINELNYQDDNIGSLKSLVESIWEVDSKYLIYTNNEGDIIEGLERVFAYELYRQWAKNIAGKTDLSGFTINGESFKSKKKFYNKLTDGAFPDMIMHSGDGETNMQEIVCEIKRAKGFKKVPFLNDIEKLWTFTSFEIPFKYGVFILVGEDLEWLVKEYCTNIIDGCYSLDEFDIKKANKIICISYINDENKNTEEKRIKQLEVCRLPELIQLSKEMHRRTN